MIEQSIKRNLTRDRSQYTTQLGPAQEKNNKPENQDEDALGKIEQQQDFVILELGASIKVGVHL